MTSASADPATVAVVGTGLIGTSIAMAATRAGDRVRGFDANGSVLETAAERAGLEAAASLRECVEPADLVFVCTPVASIGEAVLAVVEASPAALVSDVGSVKRTVLADVDRVLPPDGAARFVGGHPMTGSERTGPDAASASLLEGAAWVFTPGPRSDPEAVRSLESYATRLGAHPLTMDAEHHDRLVALVSHLPQVVSSALMSLAGAEDDADPRALVIAASGFRDVTRLAGSDPELWTGILGANREAVLEAIDLFVHRVGSVRALIADQDVAGLRRALGEAQRARGALGAKPRVRAGMALIQLPVPDRPGVLAQVTTGLGKAAVNIEDLQIVHSPWEPAGVIHLTVLAEHADEALGALAADGFEPVRVA
ncbi:MAG: prephenate dehydrogenase/arogenate dehydrogenase family protein [Actinomycetota bacterium]